MGTANIPGPVSGISRCTVLGPGLWAIKQTQHVVRWFLFPGDIFYLMQGRWNGLLNPAWLPAECSQTPATATSCKHGCSNPIVWGFGFGCFGLHWMEGFLFVGLLLLLFDLVLVFGFFIFFDCKPCRSFRSTAASPRLPSVWKEKIMKAGDKQIITPNYKKKKVLETIIFRYKHSWQDWEE